MSNTPAKAPIKADPHAEYPLAAGLPRFASAGHANDPDAAYRALVRYHEQQQPEMDYSILVYVEYTDRSNRPVVRVVPMWYYAAHIMRVQKHAVIGYDWEPVSQKVSSVRTKVAKRAEKAVPSATPAAGKPAAKQAPRPAAKPAAPQTQQEPVVVAIKFDKDLVDRLRSMNSSAADMTDALRELANAQERRQGALAIPDARAYMHGWQLSPDHIIRVLSGMSGAMSVDKHGNLKLHPKRIEQQSTRITIGLGVKLQDDWSRGKK